MAVCDENYELAQIHLPCKKQLVPENVEKAVRERRRKVKVPVIQKEQDTELPLYPSLGVYKNYLQQQGETDNVQNKQIYTSSVPAEENVTSIQTSEQEFEELTDIDH